MENDNKTSSAEKIQNMYKNGVRQCDIARELGVSRQYVHWAINHPNLSKAKKDRHLKTINKNARPKMRPEDLSRYIGRDLSILTEKQHRIFRYRLEGKSNGEIAKIEKMKKNAVVGNIMIAKHKLDGTYKQYSKNQKKLLKCHE